MQKFKAPNLYEKAFTCPHCSAYANMEWYNIYKGHTFDVDYSIYIAICQYCRKYSVWHNFGAIQDSKPIMVREMLYPKQTAIPPIEDMPESIKQIYLEASSVLGDSPRASCALLRLALQELMVYLKDNYEQYRTLKGKNINDDIGELVKLGLSPEIQQALDIVRITGNNAVHSNKELNINDTPEIAYKLFELLNFIVKEMITRPKEINSLFSQMPKDAKEAIGKRDSKK